jgi:hypothetical protein
VDTFGQSTEGIEPHTGAYFARLGQINTLGYLSQTLPTAPGAMYLLSFWLNSPDGLTPNQFLASWNGSQIYSTNNLPAFGNNPAIAWRNLQFTVTATASTTVLQFGFRDEPTALGLDDVSVVQISGFPFTAIAYTNGNLQLTWTAVPGLVLQRTPRLNPPDWQTVSGSINTNWIAVPTAEASEFFRLVKP